MELLQVLFSNLWAAFLVVLFFGGSIFVHELGHFLAARRRGLKVERFAIGMGPKLWGFTGKDGVEYWLCWIPMGGYVKLPQLADLRGLEGEDKTDAATLPPITYTSKVIVSVAGAVFNIIFAFFLATLLWVIGQKVAEEDQTTRIGVVLPQIELPNGQLVSGPALTAGLQPGDIVHTVDGKRVSTFTEISHMIMLGSGRGPNDEPKVTLEVERSAQPARLFIDVFPQKVGDELVRDIGIEPIQKVMAESILADSAALAAGLKAGDILQSIDGQPITYTAFLSEYLRKQNGAPAVLTVLRDNTPITLNITPRAVIDPETKRTVYRIGVSLRGAYTIKTAHTPPWVQIQKNIVTTYRTFVSLLSPKSDIGISKMSGPIGIVDRIHAFAKADFSLVLWFTILINVNLAIFNLLPIPVLDGGHILFATIAKLLGRPLSFRFIEATQSAFVVLLLATMLYVSVFDVRRIRRYYSAEKTPTPAAAAPATPAPETPAPAPAK